MAKEVSLVLYTASGVPIRFERCWGIDEDPEADVVHFSFKELDQTFFAQFDKSKLVGYVLEQ